MIRYIKGDILESDADYLVIPVNCVGVHGAGLAKQWAERYPRLAAEYRRDCLSGEIELGTVTTSRGSKNFVLFPTKDHWRDWSSRNIIRDGLGELARMVTRLDIKSLALPRLGCGYGGMHWQVVKPIIEEFSKRYLTRRCDIRVYHFA